ncbi:hypothetical protein [Streptosporangium lutulentum]|uniref:Uncharacterized protein n=1 Tax=Streptosporangium lutulentum TaxID=1461250 RepID=A0ABT9Q6J2_9ACTN|nr:hypothetical protein [Streptosporangium lutulentum]MDP9841938.1 hypothetical protein [Streptosporangium lutulentum]
MTNPFTARVEVPPAGRWRWPVWAGYAACGWAVTYGCVLLAIALDGGSLFGLPHGAWVAAPLLLAAAVAAAATVRPWGRRLPRRAVSAAVWTAAVLALGSSAFVLMNLIELATTGTVRDRHGDEDWAGFIERGCFAVGAALLVATALSWHHRTAGSCPRCGRAHSPWAVTALEYPPAHAAPRRVRWIAYAGCAAFVPYYAVHGVHVAGYALDGSRFPPSEALTWSRWFLFGVLIALAVFLLLGLVRPWGMVFPRWTPWPAGRRVPRFLPLTPVWVVAPTLALYGLGGGIYTVLATAGIVGHYDTETLLLAAAAMTAFGGYGWALAIAAVSYRLRTRPRCVPGSRDSMAPHRDLPSQPAETRPGAPRS